MEAGMGDRAGYATRETFAAILIGDAAATREAAQAVGLVGGGIAQRIDWHGAARGIDSALAAPIIVADARGADSDALIDGLAMLAAFAAAHEAPVVVAFTDAQIDVVTAQLFGGQVQALCDPAIADWVAALAVAGEMVGACRLHDPVRESEASRLTRLNQEVARIAEILTRLTREEPGTTTDVADRRRGYDAGPGAEGGADPRTVRRLIRLRRLRDQFFGAHLFEDPAWDMLLDLFAAELEGRRVSVSSLCIAAAVAPTTALRWITKMTENGLFIRHPDPHDRRRAFMALAAPASEAMRGYFAAMERTD